MPKHPGNQKPPVNTAPKPGLMRRLFGGPMSESTSQQWPELAQAWAGREVEMPNETMQTNRVRPMNAYERFASGDAHAVTWPWGTIALNRNAMEQDKVDLPSTLTHELTHIGQKPSILRHLQNTVTNAFSGVDYRDRAEEQEAFAAESRMKRPRDIHLRSVNTGPTSTKLAQLQKQKVRNAN